MEISWKIVLIVCCLKPPYASASDPPNIAYNKPTSQQNSSQPDTLPPNAVDSDNSTYVTLTRYNRWWSVDLGQTYYVTEVKMWSITNRLKPLTHSSVHVLLSTDERYSQPSWTSGSWIYGFEADQEGTTFNKVARHLAVFYNGTGQIRLAEFEAFTFSNFYNTSLDPLNIAYNKTTYTSGTQAPGSNRDGVISLSTTLESNQWWRVDLGLIYYIYRVKLWSRVPHGDLLSRISILSSTDVAPPSLPSESWIALTNQSVKDDDVEKEIIFNDPAAVRHLAVFKDGAGYVTLVAFDAFGIASLPEYNIAVLKNASGNASCISAASLVDGDLTTDSHRSCSDDKTAVQWKVDLGVDYNVTTIRIHCADCDTLPINDIKVKKDGSVGTARTYRKPRLSFSSFDIYFGVMETGRDIILESTGNLMKLISEVQVFGSRSLNYASSSESAVATQSSNNNNNNNQEFSARNANDGNFEAISTLLAHTLQRSNEWLKINLMQYLYVTDIVIYNRIDCCVNRTGNTTFYTTTNISSIGRPTLPDWSVCLYRAEEIRIMDHIRCYNNTKPLAVQVAIQVGYKDGVGIREFEVYGLVPGDFDGTPGVKVTRINSTRLLMTIHQWLNNMTGDVPPTSYVVYQKPSKSLSSFTRYTTIQHNKSSSTVEVLIDELSGTEEYDYKILAQHSDIIMKDLASVNVSLLIPAETTTKRNPTSTTATTTATTTAITTTTTTEPSGNTALIAVIVTALIILLIAAGLGFVSDYHRERQSLRFNNKTHPFTMNNSSQLTIYGLEYNEDLIFDAAESTVGKPVSYNQRNRKTTIGSLAMEGGVATLWDRKDKV